MFERLNHIDLVLNRFKVFLNHFFMLNLSFLIIIVHLYHVLYHFWSSLLLFPEQVRWELAKKFFLFTDLKLKSRPITIIIVYTWFKWLVNYPDFLCVKLGAWSLAFHLILYWVRLHLKFVFLSWLVVLQTHLTFSLLDWYYRFFRVQLIHVFIKYDRVIVNICHSWSAL